MSNSSPSDAVRSVKFAGADLSTSDEPVGPVNLNDIMKRPALVKRQSIVSPSAATTPSNSLSTAVALAKSINKKLGGDPSGTVVSPTKPAATTPTSSNPVSRPSPSSAPSTTLVTPSSSTSSSSAPAGFFRTPNHSSPSHPQMNHPAAVMSARAQMMSAARAAVYGNPSAPSSRGSSSASTASATPLLSQSEIAARLQAAGIKAINRASSPPKLSRISTVSSLERALSPQRGRGAGPLADDDSKNVGGVGQTTEDLVRAKQLEFALRQEQAERFARQQHAIAVSEAERSRRLKLIDEVHRQMGDERKWLAVLAREAYEAERTRLISENVEQDMEENHVRHYDYIMSLQGTEQARSESLSIRHAVQQQMDEEESYREQSLQEAHAREQDEAVRRVLQFGETMAYFQDMESARQPNIQTAAESAEYERMRRELDLELAQSIALHQRSVLKSHADLAFGQEKLEQVLGYAHQTDENRWRREREAARASVAAAREQVRQTALMLGYGDPQPEDMDRLALSRMYPELVDSPEINAAQLACSWSDASSSVKIEEINHQDDGLTHQTYDGSEVNHSLSIPQWQEVATVFMQLVVHETPVELQAEICSSLAHQQGEQRTWQLVHVRRLRRLLEQQQTFEEYARSLNDVQQSQVDDAEKERRVQHAEWLQQHERKIHAVEKDIQLAEQIISRETRKQDDFSKLEAAWLADRERFLSEKTPEFLEAEAEVARRAAEYAEKMNQHKLVAEQHRKIVDAQLAAGRVRALEPKAGTMWKKSKMGFSFNQRFVQLRPVVNISASRPTAAAELTRIDSGSESTLTMPSGWSNGVAIMVWHSEQEQVQQPNAPKHHWIVQGFRCSAAVASAALQGPAVGAASSSSSSSKAAAHDVPLTLLCVDIRSSGASALGDVVKPVEEVLAVDSESELRAWVDALVRLLYLSNDDVSAGGGHRAMVRYAGLPPPVEAPVEPAPPAPVVFPPPRELPPRLQSPPKPAFDLTNASEKAKESAQRIIELQATLLELRSAVSPYMVAPLPLQKKAGDVLLNSQKSMLRLADFPSIAELVALEQTLVAAPPSEFASFEPTTVELVLFVFVDHGDEHVRLQLPAITIFPDLSEAWGYDPASATPRDAASVEVISSGPSNRPKVTGNSKMHDHDMVTLQALQDEVTWLEAEESAFEQERAKQREVAEKAAREHAAKELEQERARVLALEAERERERQRAAELAEELERERLAKIEAMRRAFNHEQYYDDVLGGESKHEQALVANSGDSVNSLVSSSFASLKSHIDNNDAAAVRPTLRGASGGGIASAAAATRSMLRHTPATSLQALASSASSSAATTPLPVPSSQTPSAMSITTTTVTTTTTTINFSPSNDSSHGFRMSGNFAGSFEFNTMPVELPSAPVVDEATIQTFMKSLFPPQPPPAELVHSMYASAQQGLSLSTLCHPAPFSTLLQAWRMYSQSARVFSRVIGAAESSQDTSKMKSWSLGSSSSFISSSSISAMATVGSSLHRQLQLAPSATSAGLRVHSLSPLFHAVTSVTTVFPFLTVFAAECGTRGFVSLPRDPLTKLLSVAAADSAFEKSAYTSAAVSSSDYLVPLTSRSVAAYASSSASPAPAGMFQSMVPPSFEFVPMWMAFSLPVDSQRTSKPSISRFYTSIAFRRLLHRARHHKLVQLPHLRELFISGYPWPQQVEPEYLLAGLPDGSIRMEDPWESYERSLLPKSLRGARQLRFSDDSDEKHDGAGSLMLDLSSSSGSETPRDRTELLKTERHYQVREANWWDAAQSEEKQVSQLILAPTIEEERAQHDAWRRERELKKRAKLILGEKSSGKSPRAPKAHPLYSTLHLDVLDVLDSQTSSRDALHRDLFRHVHTKKTEQKQNRSQLHLDLLQHHEARQARLQQQLSPLPVDSASTRVSPTRLAAEEVQMAQLQALQNAIVSRIASTTVSSFSFAAFRQSIESLLNDAEIVGKAFDALMSPGVLPLLLAHRRRRNHLGGVLMEIGRREWINAQLAAVFDSQVLRDQSRQLVRSIFEQEQSLRSESETDHVLKLRARPEFVNEWWIAYEATEVAEFVERSRRQRLVAVDREVSRAERAARVMHARLATAREQILRTIRMWEYSGIANECEDASTTSSRDRKKALRFSGEHISAQEVMDLAELEASESATAFSTLIQASGSPVTEAGRASAASQSGSWRHRQVEHSQALAAQEFVDPEAVDAWRDTLEARPTHSLTEIVLTGSVSSQSAEQTVSILDLPTSVTVPSVELESAPVVSTIPTAIDTKVDVVFNLTANPLFASPTHFQHHSESQVAISIRPPVDASTASESTSSAAAKPAEQVSVPASVDSLTLPSELLWSADISSVSACTQHFAASVAELQNVVPSQRLQVHGDLVTPAVVSSTAGGRTRLQAIESHVASLHQRLQMVIERSERWARTCRRAYVRGVRALLCAGQNLEFAPLLFVPGKITGSASAATGVTDFHLSSLASPRTNYVAAPQVPQPALMSSSSSAFLPAELALDDESVFSPRTAAEIVSNVIAIAPVTQQAASAVISQAHKQFIDVDVLPQGGLGASIEGQAAAAAASAVANLPTPLDIVSNWCVAMDALGWSWSQMSARCAPPELQELVAEMQQLQGLLDSLDSSLNVASEFGGDVVVVSDRLGSFTSPESARDKVSSPSVNYIRAGTEVHPFELPFESSLSQWGSSTSQFESSPHLSLPAFGASFHSPSVTPAGAASSPMSNVSWSSTVLPACASASFDAETMTMLTTMMPALQTLNELVQHINSASSFAPQSAVVVSHSSVVARHQQHVAQLHHHYRSRRSLIKTPDLFTIQEMNSARGSSSGEDSVIDMESSNSISSSFMSSAAQIRTDPLRATLRTVLALSEQLQTYVTAAESHVRRMIAGWVTRQLLEEERARSKFLRQFANYESVLERHARIQLALAQQDNTRQIWLAQRAHAMADVRLIRLQSHAAAVEAEQQERHELLHTLADIAAESANSRRERVLIAEQLAFSALMVYHAAYVEAREEIQAIRAQSLDQTKKAIARELSDYQSVLKNTKVTFIMDRHNAQNIAKRNFAAAIAEIRAEEDAVHAERVEARQASKQLTDVGAELEVLDVQSARFAVLQEDYQERQASLAQVHEWFVEEQQIVAAERLLRAHDELQLREANVKIAIQDWYTSKREHDEVRRECNAFNLAERILNRQVAATALSAEQLRRREVQAECQREIQRERAERHAVSKLAYDGEEKVAEVNFVEHHTHGGLRAETKEERARDYQQARKDQHQAVSEYWSDRTSTENENRTLSSSNRRSARQTFDDERSQATAVRDHILQSAARSSAALRADAILTAHVLAERERQRRLTVDAAWLSGDKKARAVWPPYVRLVTERERLRRVVESIGICSPEFLDPAASLLQYVVAVTRPRLADARAAVTAAAATATSQMMPQLQQSYMMAAAASAGVVDISQVEFMGGNPLLSPLISASPLNTARQQLNGPWTPRFDVSIPSMQSPRLINSTMSTPRGGPTAWSSAISAAASLILASVTGNTKNSLPMPPNPTPSPPPPMSDLTAFMLSLVPGSASTALAASSADGVPPPPSKEVLTAISSIFFASLSFLSALLSLPSLPAAMQRHLQIVAPAISPETGEPVYFSSENAEAEWSNESPVFQEELTRFVERWFGSAAFASLSDVDKEDQDSNPKNSASSSPPPPQVRELLLRLLSVCVPVETQKHNLQPQIASARDDLELDGFNEADLIPKSEEEPDIMPHPSWFSQTLPGLVEPQWWQYQQPASAESEVPASVYCASTAPLYHHVFAPKRLPEQITSLEPLSIPAMFENMPTTLALTSSPDQPVEAPQAPAHALQVARAMRTLLFASLECVINLAASSESVSLLRRLTAELRRFGELQASLERRLQTLPVFAARQTELERIRKEAEEHRLVQAQIRLHGYQISQQLYAEEAVRLAEVAEMREKMAIEERAANRIRVLHQMEEERVRRMEEHRAAQIDSLREREQAYRQSCEAYAQWQGRLMHAHESARVAARVERRASIEVAVKARETERASRLQAERAALLASNRERALNSHLTRLAEDNERKIYQRQCLEALKESVDSRLHAEETAVELAEAERKQRVALAFGSAAVVTAARETIGSQAGIVLGVDRDQAALPLPPAFVPPSARRQGRLDFVAESAGLSTVLPASSVTTTASPELQSMQTQDEPANADVALDSAAALDRMNSALNTIRACVDSVGPLTTPLAPSTAKIVAAAGVSAATPSSPASSSHDMSAVWADIALLSSRRNEGEVADVEALNTARSQMAQAASSALIHSLSDLSTYIQSLENAARNLQQVRARVARVNAQSLIENERARRAFEEQVADEEELLERKHNQALAVVMMERERALRLHEFAASQEEEWDMRRSSMVTAVQSMEAERARQVQSLRDRMRVERERRQRMKEQQRKAALEYERQRHERMRKGLEQTASTVALNASASTLAMSGNLSASLTQSQPTLPGLQNSLLSHSSTSAALNRSGSINPQSSLNRLSSTSYFDAQPKSSLFTSSTASLPQSSSASSLQRSAPALPQAPPLKTRPTLNISPLSSPAPAPSLSPQSLQQQQEKQPLDAASRLAAARVAPPSLASGSMTAEQQQAWRQQQVAMARAQALASRQTPTNGALSASVSTASLNSANLLAKAAQMAPMSASLSAANLPVSAVGVVGSAYPPQQVQRSTYFGGSNHAASPPTMPIPMPTSPASAEDSSLFGGAPRLSMARSGRSAAARSSSSVPDR